MRSIPHHLGWVDHGRLGSSSAAATSARLAGLAATVVAIVAAGAGGLSGSAFAAEPTLTAPGGPGTQSYFDESRKDCAGSARNSTSFTTWTVADGVLSDVYYPDMDNTNVSTLQYIVTDGPGPPPAPLTSTFDDLQQRDTTYTVASTDPSGMVCQVTATANSGDYQLITTYIGDPSDNAVVMHTQFVPLVGTLSDYHVYVRFDGTINGAGGGGTSNGGANTALVDPTTGALVSYNLATTNYAPANLYHQPVYAALLADQPFGQEESGFVGTASDGLSELDASDQLTTLYTNANSGNVVQTAELSPDSGPGSDGSWTLALNFAPTQTTAISGAQSSAQANFATTQSNYTSGWAAYDATLNAPPTTFAGLTSSQDQTLDAQYYLAANIIKASEDKNFPGSIVSSLGGPWGQDTAANGGSATDESLNVNYRVLFERDLYETFTGLLADGDMTTAQNAVLVLFSKVEPADGEFPRDALVNGMVSNDNYAFEPDENAYPIVMAWQAGLATNATVYAGVLKAADWLVSHGPVYGDERWEEQAGYSPSTLAAEIAGLTAAGAIATANGNATAAQLYYATADDWQRNVKNWTVTTTGLGSTSPYFLRVVSYGNPNAAYTYNLGNGSISGVDQRNLVDAGFLELTRFGELPANDPTILNSLGVTDATLEVQTPSGPGWHRYGVVQYPGQATDGYGDCWQPSPSSCVGIGKPWVNGDTGTGGLWPIFDGERAEEDLQLGNASGASQLLWTMYEMSGGIGLVPEQVWPNANVAASPYGTSPATASVGFVDGKPDGSADDITWAEAQEVRLIQDTARSTPVDQPGIVLSRYVTNGPPSVVPITITSPANNAAVGATNVNVTVTGTSTPGATIVVAGAKTANTTSDTTTYGSTNAAANGTWTVVLPSSGADNEITATASTGPTATGYAQAVADTTAPTTAATITPATVGGFYNMDPMVTLTATDTGGLAAISGALNADVLGGSGVAATYYNLDSAGYKLYAGPFTIAGDGSHTLQYYSVDNAGNVATAARATTLKVDTTPPVAMAVLSPAPVAGVVNGFPTVTLSATDSGTGASGVGSIQYSIDGGAYVTYSTPFQIALGGVHTLTYRATDKAGNVSTPITQTIQINPTASSSPGATVASTLALSLGSASATFGTLLPAVAQTYDASVSANVITTAQTSTLSIYDPSSTATGHLVNGPYVLAQPLQADATDAGNPTGVFAPVGSAASPLTLLTYTAPISNDAVTIGFQQPIGATDPLRTGAYAKTLTVTLSTTTP